MAIILHKKCSIMNQYLQTKSPKNIFCNNSALYIQTFIVNNHGVNKENVTSDFLVYITKQEASFFYN